ncbi:DAK2 domain-containing protein [Pseudonocardiaceae bacterium YIM PH 21723]|nr:DAK2 domain-containing protein [Pseudonocardiaceae bacterium YIM PH 21723]
MLQALDAAAVRRWAVAAVAALDASRDAIDRINVFPVPDGDTGTNLLHTMRSALDAVLRLPEEERLGTALVAMAKGALMGARGNSGVIVSQILRGVAEVLRDKELADGAAFTDALGRADELATAAVAQPQPGTILSVLHAAYLAARESGSAQLGEIIGVAAKAAATALTETANQLADLARAGVVDAGGRGLLVLLDTLSGVIEERENPERTDLDTPVAVRDAATLTGQRESGSMDYQYEVMYLLAGPDERAAAALRETLSGIGDCVAVVGDGGLDPDDPLWSVHVHCNDIGAAIEAGIRAGRPHRITVMRFAEQIEAAPARFAAQRAVVVLAAGEGVLGLFRGEGAAVVDAERLPSLADLSAVLAGTRAAHVVLLPNSAELTSLADEAAVQSQLIGQDVVVVSTSSPVQGLAALAVHDRNRRAGDDVVAMAEAAAATRRGRLEVATEEAITWVGRCQPGDLLGVIDGEVVLISTGTLDPSYPAAQLVERMLSADSELVTVLLGRDAPETLAARIQEHLRISRPDVEVAVYPGGQADCLLHIGVE